MTTNGTIKWKREEKIEDFVGIFFSLIVLDWISSFARWLYAFQSLTARRFFPPCRAHTHQAPTTTQKIIVQVWQVLFFDIQRSKPKQSHTHNLFEFLFAFFASDSASCSTDCGYWLGMMFLKCYYIIEEKLSKIELNKNENKLATFIRSVLVNCVRL